VIDVNTGELLADGLDKQSSNNRGVYAAGQGQQNFAVANLTANQFYLIGNEVFHVPVGFGFAGVEHERTDGLFTFFAASCELFRALMINRPDGQAGAIHGFGSVDFNAIHEEAVKHNQRKGYNLLLIKGCEMARNNEKLGHYNTLFVEDLNSLYAFELKEAFLNVKKQGGIIIHNHPGNVDKYENEWHADVYSSGLIDGVEVANGIRFYPYMVRRCVDNKLTMFGNTDTHGLINHKYSTIGTFRTMTIVLAKECTEKAVKDAILKRRTIAYSGGDLIGEEKWLAEFLNAAVDCRMVSENEKKGTRKYALTNMSSITYRLRRGRITYELEPFKTTFVDFGKDKETGKYRLPKLRAENMWIADYKHPTIELSLDK